MKAGWWNRGEVGRCGKMRGSTAGAVASGAVVGFRRLSFSFRFFCLTNCVSVSVSFTFFPVECVSGGVVKGVVKVEQDR